MSENGTLEQVPIGQIKPSKLNPRKSVGDVAELAQSIKAAGVIEPLIVVRENGHFELVAGERRLAGARKAGLKTVPVIVRELTEAERREAMLIENLQREGLTVMEEAGAYKQLLELDGMTQRKLAERVGRSQGHISKRLALLELPAEVGKRVDSGGIRLEDALELTKLSDSPERLKACLRQSGQYIRYEIDRQVNEKRIEEKVAAAEAKAEKQGLTVIKHAGSQAYWFKPPKGVFKIGDGWDELPLDAKAHAKEPCHAVGIERRTGEFIPLCTDRKQHPKVKTHGEENSLPGARAGVNAARTQSKEEKAQRARREQLEQAAEIRHEFAAKLAAKPTRELEELLYRVLVKWAVDGEESDDACRLLGLGEPDEDGNYDWGATAGLLQDYANEGSSNLQRAAAAVAIAYADQQIGWYNGDRAEEARLYLTILQARGYEISDAERDSVNLQKSLEPKAA
jgi:ParB family chromosome partitioning protein